MCINGSYVYIYILHSHMGIYSVIHYGSLLIFPHFLFQSSHPSQIHDFAKRNRLDAQAAVKLAEARAALVVHPKILSIVYRQFISQGKTWVYSQSIYL